MKRVIKFRKSCSNIECKETKFAFGYLKRQGKKPWLITHPKYYAIRFHHKRKYVEIIPVTKRWNTTCEIGLRGWFYYKDIKELFSYFLTWE